MLRTNLATRPFYNERAVHLGLGLVAVVALTALYYEADRIIVLSRLNTERTTQAEVAEGEGAKLSALSADIQRSVSPEVLEEAAAAAREANLLIDQRVFSWTDFFNRIETTLPPDVMVTEVRPDIGPGSVEVTIGVLGRRLGAINEFIDALEESGAFAEVLNRSSEITLDGMYSAVLRGVYLQAVPSDQGRGEAAESARAAAPVDPAAEGGGGDEQDLARDQRADSGQPDSGGAAVDDDDDDAGADIEPAPSPVVRGGGLS